MREISFEMQTSFNETDFLMKDYHKKGIQEVQNVVETDKISYHCLY